MVVFFGLKFEWIISGRFGNKWNREKLAHSKEYTAFRGTSLWIQRASVLSSGRNSYTLYHLVNNWNCGCSYCSSSCILFVPKKVPKLARCSLECINFSFFILRQSRRKELLNWRIEMKEIEQNERTSFTASVASLGSIYSRSSQNQDQNLLACGIPGAEVTICIFRQHPVFLWKLFMKTDRINWTNSDYQLLREVCLKIRGFFR